MAPDTGLAFLSYVVLWPVFMIVSSTFRWNLQDLRLSDQAIPGHFTWFHWIRVLASDTSYALFYHPVFHSICVGAATSLLSMVIGCGLAWLVTRTDMPLKRTITFLAVIPYLLPAWVLSQAWLMFFKNEKIGGVPGFIQSIFHISPPDWLSYGFVPIVLTLSLHDCVYFFLIVGAALSTINPQLEEAASLAGARRFTILRRIVLPVVLPSILSAVILVFTKALSSYGVPQLLGTPVDYQMIATMLYSSMRSRMTSEASVLSILLLLISVAAIAFYFRALGKRRSFVTVSGKSAGGSAQALGRWRNPAAVVVLLLMAAMAVLPLLVLLAQTFLLKEGAPIGPQNFTLHYWIGGSDPDINSGEPGILKNPIFLLALKNSLKIAGISSILAAAGGLLLGYVTVRSKRSWLGRLIDNVSFFPYLIPGISLSAMYITMFAKPVLYLPALYGTLSLLVLITVVKELPFTVKAGGAAIMQLGEELEEAAVVGGASWLTSFRRILLPLTRKSFVSLFLLVFIGAMKEMELIIILVTPRTETLTTLTFFYAERNYTQLMNVMLMIIIAIVLIVYALSVKLGKADLTQGIGGQ
ncbi:ABC transporter permease [Paenibacillus hexagrammi]|uniref:Iron ABC transporter permease n=1 Tax=Paenibacillus hexagrammi TaxID=2908839 RepID=A0ABY3SHR0_9BACL|nr:iron ABC transporter permease [Paenibacillus sp. YPD9-1]UJF33028.1 iron ABC transporter permease [Paenibacillus sp. YPD9-1]